MPGVWLGLLSILSIDQSVLRQLQPRSKFRCRKPIDCKYLRTGKRTIGHALECICEVTDSWAPWSTLVGNRTISVLLYFLFYLIFLINFKLNKQGIAALAEHFSRTAGCSTESANKTSTSLNGRRRETVCKLREYYTIYAKCRGHVRPYSRGPKTHQWCSPTFASQRYLRQNLHRVNLHW